MEGNEEKKKGKIYCLKSGFVWCPAEFSEAQAYWEKNKGSVILHN